MMNKFIFPVALSFLFSSSLCADDGEQKSSKHGDGINAGASSGIGRPEGLGALAFELNDLDKDIDPCEDLYGYVNEKFMREATIPATHTSWGVFTALEDKSSYEQFEIVKAAAADRSAVGTKRLVGDVWNSGMDEKRIDSRGVTPIKPIIDRINDINDKDGLVAYLRQSSSAGLSLLLDFGPSPDFHKPEINIAYAGQSGLGLPDPKIYTDAAHRELLSLYEKHLERLLRLSGLTPEESISQAKLAVSFEMRIAAVTKTPQELARDASIAYNPVTIDEADRLTPNWSWTEFFRSQGLSRPEFFSLSNPQYHIELSNMMDSVDLATWKAYLRAQIINRLSQYLSSEFVDEYFSFYGKTLGGQKEIDPRWKRVMNFLNVQVGDALGRMYVESEFSDEKKDQVTDIVVSLKEAFRSRIKRNEWMSESTKDKALQKLDAMIFKVGYPEKWRSWEQVPTTPDGYFENVIAIRKFNYYWLLAKIGKRVDREEWLISPQKINAYYSRQKNEVVIPAGLLQAPLFDLEQPLAFNYGGIGALIAHEMTHAFDDQGRKFGAAGEYVDWWQDQDAEKYKVLSERMVRQFNEFSIDGIHVNGDLTLNENIADLGGLNVAYDAMKASKASSNADRKIPLDEDRLFFIGWAAMWKEKSTPEVQARLLSIDPHAPPKFRTNAGPANMLSFRKAFGCGKRDAGNDSSNIIQIW